MLRPVKKEASVPEIRRARPEEAEAISLLIREAFGPFESAYTAEAFEYTTPDAEKVRGRFDEGPIWVAVENDVMVGTVSGLPEPDRFYIRSMAIKPNAQRLGIGQRLLDTLESFAREAGYDTLYLYTTFVLPGAKRLYEKNGFYVLRETAPEEWCSMGGLEMEKKLSEPGVVATG
jgi:ribosomal protein S18 acetylase RimI-like enzyme